MHFLVIDVLIETMLSSKSDAINNVKLESMDRLSCGKLMNKGFSHTEKVITNFPKIAMLKSKDGNGDYMPNKSDIETMNNLILAIRFTMR